MVKNHSMSQCPASHDFHPLNLESSDSCMVIRKSSCRLRMTTPNLSLGAKFWLLQYSLLCLDDNDKLNTTFLVVSIDRGRLFLKKKLTLPKKNQAKRHGGYLSRDNRDQLVPRIPDKLNLIFARSKKVLCPECFRNNDPSEFRNQTGRQRENAKKQTSAAALELEK